MCVEVTVETAAAWPTVKEELSLIPLSLPIEVADESVSQLTVPAATPYAKERQHIDVLQFYERDVLLAVR